MITPLEQRHKDFLKAEIGVDDIDSFDDEQYGNVYDKLMDIEVDEFSEADESERGDLAVEIMDMMAAQFEDEEKISDDDGYKAWASANGYSEDITDKTAADKLTAAS